MSTEINTAPEVKPADKWVVWDGHVYRADHKPAPFTSKEGKHHPDFHDGLVALVYDRERVGIVAAAPEMLAALKAFVAAEDSFRTHAFMPGYPREPDSMSEAYDLAVAIIAKATTKETAAHV